MFCKSNALIKSNFSKDLETHSINYDFLEIQLMISNDSNLLEHSFLIQINDCKISNGFRLTEKWIEML